jgi:CRISPR-associated protein Csd2
MSDVANASERPLEKRYDFVVVFDVCDGNPNGDPDAGNAPRIDPETGHGLVSDVCLKRKIRDYVTLAKRNAETGEPEPGYDIYVKHRGVLNAQHQRAYDALGIKGDEKKKQKRLTNVENARKWMCQTFFDIRAFGAVMTTGVNCGQVRGPVQLTFSRSVDPIASLEQSIVRKAVTTEREADAQIEKHGQITGTMGRKEIVPYALYVGHGFISPYLARDTGFSEADLELLWEGLTRMFEHDRSATRGQMCMRKVVVFEHESMLGSAPAHALFDRVKVAPRDQTRPPRSYNDYSVDIDRGNLPSGITINEVL